MESEYNSLVESFRDEEYPMLKDVVYLDHAGTTIYSKSLMEDFSRDMISNLYGNPHSASASSQLSSSRIETIRIQVLQFFKADPEYFDIVFVANATAGIKLVAEAFQGHEDDFRYLYHCESHTSLIGVRECAQLSDCLNDEQVERWLSSVAAQEEADKLTLFAYPAQSNMNGRRLPLCWSDKIRISDEESHRSIFSLLDACSLAATAQLDLSNSRSAPDFTVLSFSKIFGFPDLGALIVRKESGQLLRKRKYFGGGTVDAVVCTKEKWHMSKSHQLHESLEDGTLAIHSILALRIAISNYQKLYGSMNRVSRHTAFLSLRLFTKLSSLRHGNSQPVCQVYSTGFGSQASMQVQGPIIAFNLLNKDGFWVSNSEFEKLAVIRNFHIRTGNLCNPGGLAKYLKLEPWEVKKFFSNGLQCGTALDTYSGKTLSVIRASIGAMSTVKDVDKLASFIEEFFVDIINPIAIESLHSGSEVGLIVESLKIYPIKSCGGFDIPPETDWEVRPEGLAWDREWCLVHQGTRLALNQKQFPRMALITPIIDLKTGLLIVRYKANLPSSDNSDSVTITLSLGSTDRTSFSEKTKLMKSRVCGENLIANTYQDAEISQFFSSILGVPCALTRFPATGNGLYSRHAKAHLQKHQIQSQDPTSISSSPAQDFGPLTRNDVEDMVPKQPILFSNESPILLVNRASVSYLNEQIVQNGGTSVSASVFRANIIVKPTSSRYQEAYCEEKWHMLRIGTQDYQMMGSCRRCYMICINQSTGEKSEEPFVTLAKTHRFDSKVYFGCHMSHIPSKISLGQKIPTIRVGDFVDVLK